MKHSLRVILLITGLFFSLCLFADPKVTIYRNPDPRLFGRDPERSQTITYISDDFTESPYRETQKPYLVSVIISRDICDALRLLPGIQNGRFSREGRLSVSEAGIFTFHDLRSGLHASFSCIPATENVLAHIQSVYTNSFWQDSVIKEYSKSLVFLFYGGNDLDRNGDFSYRDAMALATLLGRRDQPLLGIHDGSGYLSNIYYAILEQKYRNPENYNTYRVTRKNNDRINGLLYHIDTMYDSFPDGLFATITGSLRYNDDGLQHIQLPEDFLFSSHGSKLDFALAFYDLFKRKRYDAEILAVRELSGSSEIAFIICYKKPDTFVWGAVHSGGHVPALSEQIEDIPALVFARSLEYSVLDTREILETQIFPKQIHWEKSRY